MADVQHRISQVTSENNDLEFNLLKAVANEAFQKHAPIKQWYVRANQAPLPRHWIAILSKSKILGFSVIGT